MNKPQTALAKRPIDFLKAELAKPAMQGWLAKQIAATMNRNSQQMINVVLHAATQSPLLAECTPTSILSALCVAAQIGLVPNTALGHAWLVPFKNRRQVNGQWVSVPEATLIIGYQGLVKLVGEASGVALKAAPVYAGEPFEYNRAASPPVTLHKHAADGKRGDLLFAYCLAYHQAGVITGEVYDRAFVHARRERSKSFKFDKNSPWTTDPAAMWLKTAIRDFSKQVPKGNDARLERAIEVDNLDDAQLAQGTVADLMAPDLPPEAGALDEGDALAVDQAARTEHGPADEDTTTFWTAEIRQAQDGRALAEVVNRIGQAQLPAAIQSALHKVVKDQERAISRGPR